MMLSILLIVLWAAALVVTRHIAFWSGDPVFRWTCWAGIPVGALAIWLGLSSLDHSPDVVMLPPALTTPVGLTTPSRLESPGRPAMPAPTAIVDTKHRGAAGALWCLSVRELLARAQASVDMRRPLDDEVAGLAGIGRIEAVFVDAANRDLVLVGRVDAGRLTFGDLVTAVDNVWARRRRAPACSLEPEPENVANLRAFRGRFDGDLSSAAAVEDYLERTRALLGPQRIDIFGSGVDRSSRWAFLMVDVDYELKAVAQGLVRIEGIPSTLDIDPPGGGRAVSSRFSRFWFRVDEKDPHFLAAPGVVWIERCRVVVRDQAQAAAANGSLSDAHGVVDPVAREFSTTFTSNFETARDHNAVYGDLENLYRLLAITHAIREKQLFEKAGLDRASIATLEPTYEARMPAGLPPLANAAQASRDLGDAIVTSTRVVSGGVDMDLGFRPSMIVVTRRSTDVLTRFKTRALAHRPGPRALWWDLPASVSFGGLKPGA